VIETSTRTIQTFAAVCSSCGRHGPDADGEAEAVALAKDEHWQHWTVHKAGELTDVFICLDCRLDEQDKIIESLDPEEQ